MRCVKFRRDQGAMRVHVAKQPVFVFQEAHVAELVELVGTDRPLGRPREIPLHIGRGGGEKCETRAGKSDFRGGGKNEGSIRIAGLLAEIQDIGDFVAVRGEMVDGIGVVPEQAEVGRTRSHRREALHRFRGIDLAGGIRVFRHAPHALHGRIGDERFDLVHVRPMAGQRHRYHANAILLADGEMAVIARHGAKERGCRRLRPGRR